MEESPDPKSSQQPIEMHIVGGKGWLFFQLPDLKLLTLIFCLLLIIFVSVWAMGAKLGQWHWQGLPSKPLPQTQTLNLKKFTSDKEFQEFLTQTITTSEQVPMAFLFFESFDNFRVSLPLETLQGGEMNDQVTQGKVERFSLTNVQVEEIDEPDILKTNGDHIFYSQSPIETFAPIPTHNITTQIIRSFPIEQMRKVSQIETFGELLLLDGTLVVLSTREVKGYDVSDPANPQKRWELKLEDQSILKAARLYLGKVYIITSTNLKVEQPPCPFHPFAVDGEKLVIPCSEIYHPTDRVSANVTYTISVLNPHDGKVENSISLIGDSAYSIVYMSGKNIYLTYSLSYPVLNLIVEFVKVKGTGIIPQDVIQKIQDVQNLKISEKAKMVEMNAIVEKWLASFRGEEKDEMRKELGQRMDEFIKERGRDLNKTGIVRISTNPLQVASTGIVPGSLLNQFSLDEYQDYLRVATTIRSRFNNQPMMNDVYILDSQLNEKGSVKNLGVSERIYAVRFLGDKGYVVTFREIDPLYVLDLSDPSLPKMVGELKIPGFSSYLHPLKDNLLLGVGREDLKVKVSLFDVSNPAQPQEIAKEILDAGWSEILMNHHAFLSDDKNQVFFVPADNKGFVYSYAENNLTLKKEIPSIQAKRALFINDYLYLISPEKIVVLDERSWNIVKELTL